MTQSSTNFSDYSGKKNEVTNNISICICKQFLRLGGSQKVVKHNHKKIDLLLHLSSIIGKYFQNKRYI